MGRQTSWKVADDLYFRRLRRKTVFSRSERGFTLIELMIVMMFVSILAAIALPSYQSWIDKTHIAHAQTQMNCTIKDLEVFKLEKGYYPKDVSRDVRPAGINCFYLQGSGEVPFDSKYDYESWPTANGCYIQVTFLGKNGQKEYPSNSTSYLTPGLYEYDDHSSATDEDDWVYSLGVPQAGLPCQ